MAFELNLSWLHSFFLSRVSHKGEFYLERFLMRQHCTSAPFELSLCVAFSVSVFLDLFICYLFLNSWSLELGVGVLHLCVSVCEL